MRQMQRSALWHIPGRREDYSQRTTLARSERHTINAPGLPGQIYRKSVTDYMASNVSLFVCGVLQTEFLSTGAHPRNAVVVRLDWEYFWFI